MQFENLTPILRSWDLERSLRFHIDRPGFACDRFSEEWGWAASSHGAIALMLAAPNAHDAATHSAFTGSLYLRTADEDALWSAQAGKVDVVYPPQDFDQDMRELPIRDDSGSTCCSSLSRCAIERSAGEPQRKSWHRSRAATTGGRVDVTRALIDNALFYKSIIT